MDLITREEANELITSITDWSDDKRKEFVTVFNKRASSSRLILLCTVEEILSSCVRRKILSHRHLYKFAAKWAVYYSGGNDAPQLRGLAKLDMGNADRSVDELQRIAVERAQITLNELPTLQKALEIIDPITLKKMKRKDELLKIGEELVEKLDDASESIRMSEHPDKTVGEFLAYVKERNKARLEIVRKLKVVGNEGSVLEADIGKALFKGVPGLADAVLEACDKMVQNAIAMGELFRRVEEQVRFGDSQEAMDLLKRFEADEITVDADIAAGLRTALDRLKVAKPAKAAKKLGK